MEEVETLDLFQLPFSHLVHLSHSSFSSSATSSKPCCSCSFSTEICSENLLRTVMETLGPHGPGLLAITGVPNAPELRRRLLPLSRKLALLGDDDRRRILKDHGLGSDVPLKNLDRTVSSFALQLKHHQDPRGLNDGVKENHSIKQGSPETDTLPKFPDYEFKQLRNTFEELGSCMIELGLLLARACDNAIGSRELEQSILESKASKGRLIHYHSNLDNLVLKESKRSTTGSGKCILLGSGNKGIMQSRVEDSNPEPNTYMSNLWQQWHYDYGIFTILTAPMFLSASQCDCGSCFSVSECSSPGGHTCLQIFDATKHKIVVASSLPDSFIVQVGECADILSRGKLRSTLHSVCRPVEHDNVSRETCVVFLQPAWSKAFSVLEMDAVRERENSLLRQNCETGFSESNKLVQEIYKIVPPLSARMRDGMTFAEFSRETTKQYYRGNGIQSKR